MAIKRGGWALGREAGQWQSVNHSRQALGRGGRRQHCSHSQWALGGEVAAVTNKALGVVARARLCSHHTLNA